MDYLDLNKEFRQRVLMMVGYVLVAVAIAATFLVLLQQASGYGVNRQGVVISHGLTFFSSHPHPAQIYIDGKLKDAKTNTRLEVPEGVYNFRLSRQGYHDWQRRIIIEGQSVTHFDYPFLFPLDLSPKPIASYTSRPRLFTQTPDRRWLLVQSAAAPTDFTLFDLRNQSAKQQPLSLPPNLLSLSGASAGHRWQLEEWADDNKHVLLRHSSGNKSEYILVDRGAADRSINLTARLALKNQQLSLINRKYDRYYLYDDAAHLLSSADLTQTAPKVVLQQVLAFKDYGPTTLLYVTDAQSPKGKVAVRLTDGRSNRGIRSLPVANSYLVDLTKYSRTLYVVAGSSRDNRLYIYQDPVGQIKQSGVAAPIQTLRVKNVNKLSFSSNAQFIAAEGGRSFGVYDILNKTVHNYITPSRLDTPQSYASWMDSNRLLYVSRDKLEVFDYDNLNRQVLVTADSSYLPAFDPDYNWLYVVAPGADGKYKLTQTSLLAPADRP